MALEFTPLAPTFGVVIEGIDLRERQPELTVSTLRQLLREHRLLAAAEQAVRRSGERARAGAEYRMMPWACVGVRAAWGGGRPPQS